MEPSEWESLPSPQEQLMLLNRSVSFSDISSRKKVVIEDHAISNSGHTMFRHYSCEHLSFSPVKDMPKVGIIRQFVSEIYVANSSTSNEDNKFNFSDLKLNTNNVTQDSNKKIEDAQLIPLACTKQEQKQSKTTGYFSNLYKSSVRCFFWLLLPLICGCLGMLATQSVLHQKTCQMSFNINELQTTMDTKLFGQQTGVNIIISALQEFYSNSKPGLRVLVIFGGTGVGKSYAVSLLEEKFPWRDNIHHWIMPINSAELTYRSPNKFSSCGDNLIIFDSLSQQHISDAIQLAKFFLIHTNNKRIILVFIFNLQKLISENNSEIHLEARIRDLRTKFLLSGTNAYLIPFHNLDEHHIVLCIKDLLDRRGISLSKYAVDQVLNNIVLREGCKRVTSKIALISANEQTLK